MAMRKRIGQFTLFLVAVVVLSLSSGTPTCWAQAGARKALPFEEVKIFFEFNSTDNDLGVQVFLDAEDWNTVKIVHPNGQTIFEVTVRGGFKKLGLSEMFFEG